MAEKQPNETSTPQHPCGPTNTYVLDTGVLVGDPNCIRKFGKHNIAVSAESMDELKRLASRHAEHLAKCSPSTKKAHDALNNIAALERQTAGSLSEGVPTAKDSGTLRVVPNTTIGTALALMKQETQKCHKGEERPKIVFLTDDIMMLIIACNKGVTSQLYSNFLREKPTVTNCHTT